MNNKQKNQRKKDSKLVGKVSKFSPKLFKHDENGKYLPICTYGWHIGIIREEDNCHPGCDHYHKAYLQMNNSNKRFDDSEQMFIGSIYPGYLK